MTKRNVAGRSLVGLGILVMLIEFGLRWWFELRHTHYDISLWPVLGGASIAFVGFYIQDPKGAEDGGNFLVNAGVRIIGVVRTGNRASDPVVMITKPVEPSAAPTPPAPSADEDKP